MTIYCPAKGHKVTYTDSKPAKCPTCGADMAPKPVAASIAPTSTANARPAAPSPAGDHYDINSILARHAKAESAGTPEWAKNSAPPEFPGAPVVSDIDTSAIGGIVVNKDAIVYRPMTIEELQKQKDPIERSSGRPSAPEGNRATTAADLVQDLIRNVPVQQATASAAPAKKARRTRKPKQSSS